MGRKRNFCRVVIALGMLALVMAPGHPVRFQLSRAEVRSPQAGARQGRAVSRLEGDTLEAVTAMVDPHGQQVATALVDLPAAYVGAEILRKLQLAVAVAVIVLLLRGGELGGMARVFVPMAREVQAREQRVKQQVHELQIEVDTVRRERHVAEITGTDYFQELQRRAGELRSRAAAAHPPAGTRRGWNEGGKPVESPRFCARTGRLNADSVPLLRDFYNNPEYSALLLSTQTHWHAAVIGTETAQAAMDAMASEHTQMMRDASYIW